MLCIFFKDGSDFTYHVGKRTVMGALQEVAGNHDTWDVGQYLGTVNYIQADGHELELILNTFTLVSKGEAPMEVTIPFPIDKRVVCWYGDIARTILMNI